MLERFVTARLRGGSEPLVPPQFSACVAHLRAESANIGERSQDPSQLRRECQTRYQAVQQEALARLIADDWLIGAGRELGIGASGREAEANVDRGAELGAAIQRTIEDRVAPITRAQVADYYQQHRFEYLVTAERDVKIARTSTEASAVKVKAEIASGMSFASVVRKLSVRQPDYSNEGLVIELQPHAYGEPKLNQAIFTAAPGVLTGPISTWYGYFVFEVTRIRFEHLEPLPMVEASIRRQLARPLREQALAAFTTRWRATWTARTDCSPGYVVRECRQFNGSPAASAESSLPTLG